ncbi:MAG: RNA methyltransferase [Candidatus Margulisiibacteriota bacterium]|jgi:TrmH family RNA methyltransferase
MQNLITSTDNLKIKQIKKLLESKKARTINQSFVLEHLKAIKEIAQKNPTDICYLIFEENSPEKEYFASFNLSTYLVDSKIFKAISSLKTSKGVLAIIKKPIFTLAEILKNTEPQNLVLAVGISNPNNLGALIRNAVAFKINAVLCLEGTVDPYHPDAIQASAGNIYQLPIIQVNAEDLALLKKRGYTFFVLDAHLGQSLSKTNFTEKNLFIFGSEGAGLKNEFEAAIKPYQKIIIETDNVESLNVAVSSGILFYFKQILAP